MTTFAIANLTDVSMGPDIATYVSAIDETLAPFGGRFLLHGGHKTMLEGAWPGDLVVIRFADRASAIGRYRSDAYQRILPLRMANATGAVMLVDGVDLDHHATDILGDPAAVRRGLGVSVVQRAASGGVHGRYRVAGAWRGTWGDCRLHQA